MKKRQDNDTRQNHPSPVYPGTINYIRAFEEKAISFEASIDIACHICYYNSINYGEGLNARCSERDT